MSDVLKSIRKSLVVKLSIFVLVFFLFVAKTSAAPSIFTVINTNDSGPGSLRQAITDANSNGNPGDMDIIAFNIPGSEVHTITPLTPLPLITQKVKIDGYTQPGTSPNTAVNPQPINAVIKIEIDGKNIDGMIGGMGQVGQNSGIIFMQGDSSELHGLSIYGFGGYEPGGGGINNANTGGAASDLKFQGNFLGLRADGTTLPETIHNDCAIGIFGPNALIGGTNPADRNVLANKSESVGSGAVWLSGDNLYAEVYGNIIGLAKDGETDLSPEVVNPDSIVPPFSSGITTGNTQGGGAFSKIGGPQDSQTNLISGNYSAVNLGTNSNTISNNLIGTNWKGEVKSSITNGFGVGATVGSDNIIGGTGANDGNIIAGVAGAGVIISSIDLVPFSFKVVPQNNTIIGNSISSIKVSDLQGIGDSNMGIDIAELIDDNGDLIPDQFINRGPNLNDDGDADDGSNNKLNYPVIKSAQQTGNQINITYDLDVVGSPSNTYRVEFFVNSKRTIFGYGPGETLLGVVESTSPGVDKQATLTVADSFAYESLSATTTAIDAGAFGGFGPTSEFSKNIQIADAGDKDADGISDAIEDAAPNNGDANGDGIADSLQATVTSYKSKSGSYLTLVTEGCSENGLVSSIDGATLNKQDNGYHYPFGLTDFTLNCGRGGEVDVKLLIHTSDSANVFRARKYNSKTQSYSDLTGSQLTQVDVGSAKAISLSYKATDGGTNDDDGVVNGIIVDPVGLAAEGEDPFVEVPGKLVNTGVSALLSTLIGSFMIAGALWTYFDYIKCKKPLVNADKELKRSDSKSYTYWHHLRVVSLPLAQYRLRLVFEKKSTKARATV